MIESLNLPKNTGFHLRMVEPDDVNRCYEIWRQGMQSMMSADKKSEARIRKKFTESFNHPDHIITVVTNPSGLVIGWQAVFPLMWNPIIGPSTGQISTYFDTTMQVPGLGPAITKCTIAIARERGIEHIYSFVKSDNRGGALLSTKFACERVSVKGSTKGAVPDFHIFIFDI